MELFKENLNGHKFTYLLENIEENFGVMDLDEEHTLVALLEPSNHVEPLKLDGHVGKEEIQKRFGLNPDQSAIFAQLLNRHIPNRDEDNRE